MLCLLAYSTPSHCPPPRAHQNATGDKFSAPAACSLVHRDDPLKPTGIPLPHHKNCPHQPKGDHASWQWATQPIVSSNMFQTSMSIISHHHKTRGKEADISCLSSVTIATLIYRKQGFVALHAILVKKRISLPSLPHSITKRLLQIHEITFCLKALFGIMVTLAPIYCTFCFWLCHKFDYLTSTSL